jgi:two-component system, LytTR family, response regulator
VTILTVNETSNAKNGRSIIWVSAAVPLWIAYAFIFAGTEGQSLGRALCNGSANVIPLVAIALAYRMFLPRLLVGHVIAVQVAIHVLAAMVFSASWYTAVTILLAGVRWIDGHTFQLIGFEGPALAWQMLQGIILYCAVAAIVQRSSTERPSGDGKSVRNMRRYLVKDGENFRPVEVAKIVTIRGAQDYCEVTTLADKHLVRLNLAEFDARLDSGQFIRVHRSTIVHLAYLNRLEPAGGGRMLAHMRNGEIVSVSRTGAQILRSLVV